MRIPTRRLLIWLPVTALLAACIAAAGYLIATQPIFSFRNPGGAAVTWSGLPVPTVTRPQWTTYSHTAAVNDLLLHDGLLWAATEGGVVVWDPATQQNVTLLPEHGLGGSHAAALAADLRGAVWIATTAGVSRYDGAQWQTFSAADGLPANDVRDLAVTADGTIWAATADGLARFNGRRWITHNRANTFFGLPGQNVRALSSVPGQNALWIATDAGLSYFDGARWQAITRADGGLPTNNIFDVSVTADGVLWAAHSAGLSRFDGVAWSRYAPVDGLLAAEVRHVTAVSNDAAWISYGPDAAPATLITIAGGVPTVRHTPANLPAGVRAILPTGDGVLLGASAGLGLLPAAGAWQPWPTSSALPTHAFSSALVARDALWLGSDHGVSRFDGRSWRQFTRDDGLAADAVAALAAAPGETPTAAFAAPGMGLSAFRSDGSWQTLACPAAAPVSSHIYAAAQAPDGAVWLGGDGGVARFKEGEWSIYTAAHGLPGSSVWTLTAAPDGAIWAGTDAGVATYTGDRWTVAAPEEVGRLAAGPDGVVWALTNEAVGQIQNGRFVDLAPLPAASVGTVQAVSGGLWMGSTDGVAFLGAGGGRLLTTADGLPFNRTPVVTTAPDGTLWAVSESGAVESENGYYAPYTFNHRYVSFLDGDVWRSQLVADADRPLHGAITAIQPAADGAVWVGTLAGVSRYNGAAWQSYTVADGLPGHAVHALAAAYGSIWVGAEQGVVRLTVRQENGAETAVVSHRLAWQGEGDAFPRLHLRTAPDGALWASDGRQLSRFDGAAWQAVPIDAAVDLRLDGIAFDENGRLWASATNVGADGSSARIFLGVRSAQGWTWLPVQPPAGETANPLHQLTFAADGRLWAAGSGGVWIFDPAAATFAQAQSAARRPITQVTALAAAADGAVWVASRLQGTLLQIRDGEATPVDAPLDGADRLYALALAGDGALWLGGSSGAARLQDGAWTLFAAESNHREGVTSTLSFAPDGALWLGTGAGDVLRFDGRNVTTLPRFTDPRSEERPYLITAIFTAEADNVWIASVGGGVARSDNGGWRRLGSSAFLYSGRVSSLAFDADGAAWIGSSDGLFTRSQRAGCRPQADALWTDTQAIAAAPDGTLWFVGDGLVFRRTAGRYERSGYQALPLTAVAPDGALWLATNDGLVRQTGQSRQALAFPFEAAVRALAVAPNGRLWVGSDAGLFAYDGQEWLHLTTQQGLAHDRVNHVAVTPDGAVWAMTDGGVSRYQP